MLLATVFLAAPLRAIYPTTGLDQSWITGLNLARLHGFQFGTDLVFTYGPWGFLDTPRAIGNGTLVAGSVFAILAVSLAWSAYFRALRGTLGPNRAAIASALVVIFCLAATTASALLLTAAILAVLHHVGGPEGRRPTPWVPAAAAACAALLLQIKFSEGVALVAISFVAAQFSPGRRLPAMGQWGLSLVVSTVILWLAAGQSLANFPHWLRYAVAVASGYGEAMSTENKPNVLSYVALMAVVIVVAGYAVRFARRRDRRAVAAVALVAFLTLLLGFKEGASRHDAGHMGYFFVDAIPLLAWFVTSARSQLLRLTALAAVVCMVAPVWLPPTVPTAFAGWGDELQLLVDRNYSSEQLAAARMAAQQQYQLSSRIRAEIGDHPVAIDPWEDTAAWAFHLRWHPAPVFQAYSAYTPSLDALNTRSLENASPEQDILREANTGSVDRRNLLWDPPRMMLTEVCDYRVVDADATWMLLQKSSDRCSAEHQISTVDVSAGRPIEVPRGDASDMVVMSFTAREPGVLVRLGRLVDKSFHPLTVTANGKPYRLPRALAGGPLILRLPRAADWPAAYQGGSSYPTVQFSESGTVTFSSIALH